MAKTTLVIIPTYNEVENLPVIVGRLRSAAPQVDVLVVDDNSPDGTGAAADDLAAQHDEVHVLHRAGKEGLLAAYRAGFEWALERDYEVICQMDADGSHAPEELGRLLEAIDAGADLVIGSRYVEGGEVKNWPQNRYQLSKWGNRYIGVVLGEDVRDMTAGYRAFRRELLEEIDFGSLSPKGYIFQVDMARRALDAGFDVREVPVTFEDRTRGESKLDASFAGESFVEVSKWGWEKYSTLAKELTKEFSGLVAYEVDRSGLWKLRLKAEKAPEKVVRFLAEGAKLGAYEFYRSRLKDLPERAARRADEVVSLFREGVRLGDYEVKGRK
ncbi:polyprenol monophosphomannose synthase [Corynebacterium mayonis]|uniref:polyprenol monophosphomannose synthase n=1 Tax=Corynebacterium mayonis TaxID=3062461 RepID=UPI0031404C88